MQCGKFQICSNCLAIPSHSAFVDGAFIYSDCKTFHIALHVSLSITPIVERPIRKLNESVIYRKTVEKKVTQFM